ncbi:hypothetical protein N658DRAFT_56763 [Parathielavia hyrcaniae]|uniref:Uncharacterized protein n=1 Tax=Parathielavia hyrcaniae TaxID=113614 RepID=A0AAN6PUY2_9PEZI|nr:hypothetical protein N658DRAFT_56763 [Parathielavia hyrcaniae]
MFSSSAGVYLALLEVDVGLSSTFVDHLIFCLTGRRLFAGGTVPQFSVPWCTHGSQVNCTMKVAGAPSTVTRFRTAFPSDHSSNFATGTSSVSLSLSEEEPCDNGGMQVPRPCRRFARWDDL